MTRVRRAARVALGDLREDPLHLGCRDRLDEVDRADGITGRVKRYAIRRQVRCPERRLGRNQRVPDGTAFALRIMFPTIPEET